MRGQVDEGLGERDTRSPLAEESRYVARQPILDRKGRVFAYDLLFRDAPESVFRRDADLAVETILDNQVIFGLDRLTNGLPAFVTCTAQALLEGWVLVLAPSTTVLGLPACIEASPALMNACRLLKDRGFRLSLDDFGRDCKGRPLLELADFVRLDFRKLGELELRQLVRRGLDTVSMVAQKVETAEDQKKASALGFNLFQGDFFCHPVLLKKRKVPANRLPHLEIVRELYHDPLNIKKSSELVRRDASLTFRLLRLVNSPIYALYREIQSIEDAITVMGEATFRRIVLLAVLSEMNMEQSPAILNLALVRARFCELAADDCGLVPQEQYLLGMMSLLPAMLGVPMEEIAPTLPLRGQVCEALAGTMNRERQLLGWLECHVHGDWEECDRIAQANGLDSSRLAQQYLEAVSWASQAFGV